jgi:hypothetical protein
LEIARKAAERAAPAKKANQAAKDKIAERLEAQLNEIESKFFEQFPVEEDEIPATTDKNPETAEEQPPAAVVE